MSVYRDARDTQIQRLEEENAELKRRLAPQPPPAQLKAPKVEHQGLAITVEILVRVIGVLFPALTLGWTLAALLYRYLR